METTCQECNAPYTAKTNRSRYCSARCRNRVSARARMIPCAMCGEPMHRGRTVRKDGLSAHNRCRRAANESLGYGIPEWHGVNGYQNGCRCNTCSEAKAQYMRDYFARTNYWSRPDVVARRHHYRQTPWVKTQEREAHRAWTEANRQARALHYKTKSARRRNAPAITFTPAQLEQRLSMWPHCWICRGPLGDRWHVDHVKPLAVGGWNCLANLRPACARCNLAKGSQWPYTPPHTGDQPWHAMATAPTTATATG